MTRLAIPGSWQLYTVLTPSMGQTIPQDSLIVAKRLQEKEAARLLPGAIITFNLAGQTTSLTHRIIRIDTLSGQRRYQTKGDANQSPDPVLVEAHQVRSSYLFHIPKLGRLLRFAQSIYGIGLFLILPVMIIVAQELQTITDLLVESRLQKLAVSQTE